MPTLSLRIDRRLHRIDIDEIQRKVDDLMTVTYKKMPADIRSLRHLVEHSPPHLEDLKAMIGYQDDPRVREHLDAVRSDYGSISARNEQFLAYNKHMYNSLMTTPGAIGALGLKALRFTILMRTYKEHGLVYARNLVEITALLDRYD